MSEHTPGLNADVAANARLIAAAPDLLDALIDITLAYKSAFRMWTGKDIPDDDRFLVNARAAIAKATED
jgi:hypothetical protein